MKANAKIRLDMPALCTVVRRLETDTDSVDEEVGPMYEVILQAYEDELTLIVEPNVT